MAQIKVGAARLAALTCILLALASCAPLPAGPAPGYTNPVLDRDFPDPAVLRAPDGRFYAYATQSGAAGAMRNIQAARSDDLVHWQTLGDALPVKPAWAAGKQQFWAPHVLHDAALKKYFMYYAAEPDAGKGRCLGIATSGRPEGPFTDSGAPLLCGKGIEDIDPMAFDDPRTGQRLLFWGSGGAPIRAQELAADRLHFAPGSAPRDVLLPDPEREYGSLIEGAWVVFRNGTYYLFYSGDRCCGPDPHYAIMVAAASSALGPYRGLSDPAKAGSDVIVEAGGGWLAPGHCSVISDGAGRDWILYHAARATDAGNPRRARVMLLDRIEYRDGWPRVEGDQPSATTRESPQIADNAAR
jgi:arabinan endo-1,5-alpha-L-arabinosidase